MAPRILIVYATAGAGHRRAAEAIAQALRVERPEADVQCLDVLEYTPRWFQRGYTWSYLFLVRHLSGIWNISYALLEYPIIYRCVQPVRRAWNLWVARAFVRLLRAQHPAAVVTTHFLSADVCRTAKRAGWWNGAFIVVVTDFHPHWFWVAPEAEAMVIGTAEGAAVLERRGVPRDRIHVVGIPIGRAFSMPADRAALAQRWALTPQRLTVLVTSGGTTVGRFEQVVVELMALEARRPGRMQLLVVCGQDDRIRQRLVQRSVASAMPVRVFGFVEYMAELMAASDLIVTKAGGLTVSEALGRGLPLVLYHIIPGQERMNALYAQRHGAAVIAHRPRAVALAVEQLLDHPQRLGAMRAVTKTLSHSDASRRIVSEVLLPLLPPQ